MLIRIICFCCLCIACLACGSEDQNEKLLEQAGQLHLEAVELNKNIQPTLKKMSQVKLRLEKQEGELTADEQSFLKQAKQLEQSYVFWEKNHVEVPGFEHGDHDHDHDHHDHDHDHGPTLEVSASDMLLIQQEFKDSLIVISERLEKLQFPVTLQLHN